MAINGMGIVEKSPFNLLCHSERSRGNLWGLLCNVMGKKHLLVCLFALLARSAIADGLDQAGEVLLPLFIIAVNIPTIIAAVILIILSYRNKYGWALAVNSIIWLLFVGSSVWGVLKGYNENLFSDWISVMCWLPMTIVYVLTMFFYFLSKTKS